MENNCFISSIFYNAYISRTEDPIGKNYIGLTEGSFKQRYSQHALFFRNRHYASSTELSKFIWYLKDSNTDFEIKWSNLTSAAVYTRGSKTKRCNLWSAEKLFIIKTKRSSCQNREINASKQEIRCGFQMPPVKVLSDEPQSRSH